jgi:hypothetical protein
MVPGRFLILLRLKRPGEEASQVVPIRGYPVQKPARGHWDHASETGKLARPDLALFAIEAEGIEEDHCSAHDRLFSFKFISTVVVTAYKLLDIL